MKFEQQSTPNYASSPQEIKDYVKYLHESYADIDRKELDTILLGTTATHADALLWQDESDNYYSKSARLYPNEMAWKGSDESIWTPYDVTRGIVRDLDLKETDTFYDLGAGYGRLVLYAGITAVAACKGIEMVSERADLVKASIEKLELDNTEFIEGKVQDQDYSDGDVFYMYFPFSRGTFETVFDQLEEISASKPITVVSRGSSIALAKSCGRFKNLEPIRHETHANRMVSYYETSGIANTNLSRVKSSIKTF